MLRLIVTVALIIPILLMYLLSPSQIPNLYVLMLLKTLIPMTVVGYLLFGIADQVCSMFGLLDKAPTNFDELTLTEDGPTSEI